MEQELERLQGELAEIDKKCKELETESRNLREKRDELNGKVKELILEAKSLKENRDKLNEKIREIKSNIEVDRKKLNDIEKERRKIIDELERTPSKFEGKVGVKELEKKIRKLDWMIQTTPLSLDEERAAISKIKELKRESLTLKKIERLRKRLEELDLERKALSKVNRLRRDEIGRLAEESRSFHEKLLSLSAEISGLKSKADETHKMFVEVLTKVKDLRKRRTEIRGKIRDLKAQLRSIDEEERKKREQKILESLRMNASKKLERGERLSWEEFKALGEVDEFT
ncbi:hypothetical protein J7L06_10425 [Candidatus Bathyarchaeota archaeon]|nr:hypothetical protein [Candidatus Bathyarchaeota archaeon]